MGESETFYSWLIVAFNISSLFASLAIAVLEKLRIPNWYLLLGIFLAHTIGFLTRALSYQPALIVMSSFLVGLLSGGHYATSFTYIAKSTLKYEEMLIAESGDQARGKGACIRNRCFSSVVIFGAIGQIVGNGNVPSLILRWAIDNIVQWVSPEGWFQVVRPIKGYYSHASEH